MNRQNGVCDAVSICNAIPVPILLHVICYFISVIMWWDMMIRQCSCKGQIGHDNDIDCKSQNLTTNDRDIVLPVAVMFDNGNQNTHETNYHNISQWCRTSHRCSGQSAMRSGINDNCHAAYDRAFNCITHCTDQVHMVEMLKIPYGRWWKSRRMSWMGKGEEFGLKISKTSVQHYMRLIAGRKRWNVIRQRHLSLR